MVRLARRLHSPEDDPRSPHAPRRVLAAISIVSVIVVAYNAGATLTRCLDSLAGERDLEAIVVNNGEEGPEIAAASDRELVKMLRPGSNLGFAGGCNLGARNASGDVLVFLNPDTVVAPGAIGALADALEDRSVGIAMPRLRLLEEPELLNSAGNVLHVSGLAWPGGYRQPADSVCELRDVPYASGAALAIRADRFRELGGFTEEFFLYQEDLELSWRARLHGFRVVVTPEADVWHDYSFVTDLDKLYFLERNRLIFVLTAFSGRLLLLTAPVLLATELALSLLSLRQGWFGRKAAGWAWVLGRRGWLRQHRRATQSLRLRSDGELASFLTAEVEPGMVPVPQLARLFSPLLRAYWSFARRLL